MCEFDFSTPGVLADLTMEGRDIKFIGTASSHFQDDPTYAYDQYRPSSDWAMMVVENLAGRKSNIKPKLTADILPHFMRDQDQYIDRAMDLHQNMFRTSIDMAKVFPYRLEVNTRTVEHYMMFMMKLRSRGLEPLIVLNHFTMPAWLDQGSGAWLSRDCKVAFMSYAQTISKYFGNKDRIRNLGQRLCLGRDMIERIASTGLVRYWMTLNEPIMVPLQGYIQGISPPFMKGRLFKARKVMKRMVEAHDILYHELKGMNDTAKVGVGYNWQYWDGPLGGVAHKLFNERLYTDMFERGGKHSDYLGLQYYFRQTAGFHSKKGREYSDHPNFGDIYPEGIRQVLRRMHDSHPGKDIIVSEIGFSDHSDIRRPYWILETVANIVRAIQDGVHVKGILYWTLVDNLEWHNGMDQHFGLFSLDELSRDMSLPPKTGRLRSYEVWRAVSDALIKPTVASLRDLQALVERARALHDCHEEYMNDW